MSGKLSSLSEQLQIHSSMHKGPRHMLVALSSYLLIIFHCIIFSKLICFKERAQEGARLCILVRLLPVCWEGAREAWSPHSGLFLCFFSDSRLRCTKSCGPQVEPPGLPSPHRCPRTWMAKSHLISFPLTLTEVAKELPT